MTAVKKLVSILIKQHRVLQADLQRVEALAQLESPNPVDIESDLQKFRLDLQEHLDLENGVFYVELLDKMREKGQDTKKTETFISEMHEVGKTVMAFLDKYNESGSVKAGIVSFQKELHEIIETLNLRIESEESGVYAYWGLF